MFDTIVNPSSGVPRQRWTTAALSAAGHVAVMIAVVLSTIYATTDMLPAPRDVITFVSVAPPPPPPPPPPAVTEPAAPERKPTIKRAVARPAPVIAKAPVAAPIEAPETIAPETGLEGGEFAADVDAGFENGVIGGITGGIVGGFQTAAPPPPPAPVAPVRVGGAISEPRLLHRVEPEYPQIAVNAQIEGVVILEATVDHTGAVKDARVLRSRGILDEPAVRAVEQWRYEPLLLNGQPMPFVLTVTVSFSLGRP
jgi:periplasmic protein TonB